MKVCVMIGAAGAAFSLAPALAQPPSTITTETVKKDGGGTAPGAAGGVVAGALVAGPIGAVMGGIAGATVGHTVAPPGEVRTYVATQTVEPLAYPGQIEMGKRIDGEVAWREVPKYSKYHWARLNNQRVVVDDAHTVVAIYAN